ncbi:MAG: hypothetical protein U1B80_04985 [Anaerolineaceae bacterium]|nr:hypothetical protein [Anaerolineaceae bacterium]
MTQLRVMQEIYYIKTVLVLSIHLWEGVGIKPQGFFNILLWARRCHQVDR